jgi:hypothetical protein
MSFVVYCQFRDPGQVVVAELEYRGQQDSYGFEISGKITTTHVNNNAYAVYTKNCDGFNYANNDLTTVDEVTMQGTITAETAGISFTVGKVLMDYFTPPDVLGFVPTFMFTGTRVPGAQLITTGDQIATQGVYEDPREKAQQATIDKIKGWLYPTIGRIAGLLLVLTVLCCFCCIRRSRRNRSTQYATTTIVNGPNQAYEPYGHDESQNPQYMYRYPNK